MRNVEERGVCFVCFSE